MQNFGKSVATVNERLIDWFDTIFSKVRQDPEEYFPTKFLVLGPLWSVVSQENHFFSKWSKKIRNFFHFLIDFFDMSAKNFMSKVVLFLEAGSNRLRRLKRAKNCSDLARGHQKRGIPSQICAIIIFFFFFPDASVDRALRVCKNRERRATNVALDLHHHVRK